MLRRSIRVATATGAAVLILAIVGVSVASLTMLRMGGSHSGGTPLPDQDAAASPAVGETAAPTLSPACDVPGSGAEQCRHI